jgi:hypothetical protein
MNAIAPINVTALMPADMDQAIRLAKAMSSAKMLPKHLQDDVGTCLMIVEQAMRWGMSPFAVAQCTSSIGGKLMWEGKLVAAAVESCGAIEGHFDYDLKGEGDDRQVTVSAKRRGETSNRQLTIRLRDVRTTNEHWKKQPDQMLCYSGVRNWARRFTPSALLGVYSPEEFSRDGKPAEEVFAGTTLNHEAEPPAQTERDRINAETPMNGTPKRERSPEQLLDGLEIAMRDCGSLAEVNKLIANRHVQDMLRDYKNGDKSRLDGIIAAGIGAHAPVTHDQDARDQQADSAWPGAEPAEMENA